jgi:hypothetical protein
MRVQRSTRGVKKKAAELAAQWEKWRVREAKEGEKGATEIVVKGATGCSQPQSLERVLIGPLGEDRRLSAGVSRRERVCSSVDVRGFQAINTNFIAPHQPTFESFQGQVVCSVQPETG